MVANYQNLMTGGYSREINIDVIYVNPRCVLVIIKKKIELVIYWNISNQQIFFLSIRERYE